MNLMLDVAAFGVFGAKKFPARRQIVKKASAPRPAFRGFTSVAHDFEPAAIDNDSVPAIASVSRCRQAKSDTLACSAALRPEIPA